MSDDLSAFFAKKKDKKKKTVVKMDDVGQILERKAKRQEEHDLQTEEEDKGVYEEEPKQRGAGGVEDSEWIEFGDTNQGRLEGLKIKDMGAETEMIEDEPENEEEQAEQHESTRTWGQVEKKVDEDVETAADMAKYQTQAARPAKFVPSAFRDREHFGVRGRSAQIDVSNQEMFPSLADASKIEKDKKEDTKTGGGWVKSGSSENRPVPLSTRSWGGQAPAGPPSSGRDREGALAAVKALAAASAQQPAPTPRVVSTPAAAPVTAPAPVEAPKAPAKPAYVPPHLRNK